MKREEYGLITFKSTHYALQAEELLKDNSLVFKTIPTPREVSHSCGLALLFMLEDLEVIRSYIEKGLINFDGVFKYIKENQKSSAEKIM